MLLGDKVTAAEAANMGMIYKVLDAEVFESESKKIAETLAKMPTKALQLTKQALIASQNNTLTEQLQLEDVLQTQAAKTHDFEEGVAAFIQKRTPVFLGR
jgi:2-(1,2-epoxy-1,2-dihydrophenyl)acetyl-CoA isomerase